MEKLKDVKVGDCMYYARWIVDYGRTYLDVEVYTVTSLTPSGFYARRTMSKGVDLMTWKTPSKWYGHNTRVMRATEAEALARMEERTRTWHEILTRNLESCTERIRAIETGESEFSNNVSEWS